MKKKTFLIFLNAVVFIFFLLSFTSSQAADYYISCYYYDSNQGKDSKNPSLMRPSTIFPGASSNFYWAIDDDSQKYTKLSGFIEDGFFLELRLNQKEVVQKCNHAIEVGTVIWRTKPTFKLYDIKASRSNYDGFEYPIRFVKDDNNKSAIKQIVVFGDSLSDTGNLKRWTKVMPYFPFWFGRFSDGFIWNDYLNKLTNIPILNFSYGGAKTEGSNNFYVKDYTDYILSSGRNIVTGSSKDYINNYINNYLTANSYQTKTYNITRPKDTLYIIWIGANDYISTLTTEQFTEDFFDYPDSIGGSNTVSKRAVDNIIDQIEILQQRGAYHFLVLNLPDFGKTPLVMDMFYNKHNSDMPDRAEFASKISNVIQNYNKYLDTGIKKLKRNLDDEIDITYLDLGSNFDLLLSGKNLYTNENFDYGFSLLNSKYPIEGSDNKFIQNYCYKAGYLKASKLILSSDKSANDFALKNSCQTPDGKINKFAIFWNSPHPTSYTHCWISYVVQKKLEGVDLIKKLDISIDDMKKYCTTSVQ
ncbi:SGNH/GDSL hydrolase family protein [Silvanigrella aquatica]|uniref:SGNH hydrolase-type esterase domain-containing protein n=1 Tax=Silvanigrella aquatica TaxID=1915309 RepID=A0A1L4CY64_9BACT|nr:SGNH/GDSL hydrolase family protein [Silvanigrella aquatica]APJ02888.1 hypothetical protein AXG55_02705 [Silvanigrella aquatica]